MKNAMWYSPLAARNIVTFVFCLVCLRPFSTQIKNDDTLVWKVYVPAFAERIAIRILSHLIYTSIGRHHRSWHEQEEAKPLTSRPLRLVVQRGPLQTNVQSHMHRSSPRLLVCAGVLTEPQLHLLRAKGVLAAKSLPARTQAIIQSRRNPVMAKASKFRVEAPVVSSKTRVQANPTV
jgi:hypothetical protein